jgi:hypothetical protein
MFPYEEPIDERYRIRFSVGSGGKSALSHGYSIKFILIDEKNLLLYRNILELGYSSVKRSVKTKTENGKGKKDSMPSWNNRTVKLLSENFVDESVKIIGEYYHRKIRKAVNRLIKKVDEISPSQKE